MTRSRSRALTLHNVFQVPLEGTALTLGILGVVAASIAVYLLQAIGLRPDTSSGFLSASLWPPLQATGFVFTAWGWSAPTHWFATLLIEIALWALVGAAISRTVIRRVSENQPMGVRTALGFAACRSRQALAFLGLAVGVFLVLGAPLLVVTLIGRLPAVGPALGTGLYLLSAPVLLLLAMLATAVALAAFPVGYFFLPAALACREGSLLDCAARAIGYAFARPFLFVWDLFKVVVFACGIGYVGTGLLPWVVHGMPTLYGLLPAGAHPAGLSSVAAVLQDIVLAVARLVTGGFVAAYLFGAGSLIYLSLRLEVDGVDFAGPTPEDPEPGAEA
ncbi:MAG: hypothetical protein JXQ29_09350 [Planctomycetes bacterium]|nr:hypothetical protein [Planctomycetota bacterium]